MKNITINRESNYETVAKFLKVKGFSFKSIKKLSIDGKKLKLLKEENIEQLDIKNEEKDKLKILIRKLSQKIKPIEQNYKYNGFFILTIKRQKGSLL